MSQNKRFSALLLSLAILLALAPQAYFLLRADAQTNGWCGPHLSWSLNGLVLTLDGTGETFDDWGEYSSFTSWFVSGSDRYYEEVTSIIIPEGMTRIKQYDFVCFDEVCSVTILNPMCEIYDGKYTFGSNTYYEAYGMTIYGYVGSTAEAYAKKFGYDFVPLDDPNPFEDVKSTDYFYNAVLWAVGQGVTTGTSDTTFSPKNDCTRGQVVTFLWRANGKPEPKSAAHSFVDIDSNAYYYKAVLWAVENGITKGMDDTHFKPKNTCTRGQVVTFLWRAKWEPAPKTTTHPFVDVDANAFYYRAMLWAVENKITNGMDETHFKPNDVCNRAQVVTFLYRAKDVPSAAEKPPTVTAAADKTTLPDGESATLNVTVKNGKAPFEYLWQSYSRERETWLTTMQTGTVYTTNKAGEYRCQVTDANGTVVYSNTVVIQWAEGTEELKASISASKTSIASGEKTTLSVTVTGGLKPYRYQWMEADTTFGIVTISGATESSYVATSPGTYECIIYDGHNQSVNVWIEIGSK